MHNLYNNLYTLVQQPVQDNIIHNGDKLLQAKSTAASTDVSKDSNVSTLCNSLKAGFQMLSQGETTCMSISVSHQAMKKY